MESTVVERVNIFDTRVSIFAAKPLLHSHIVELSAWMKQRLLYHLMGRWLLLSKVALLAENVELLKVS